MMTFDVAALADDLHAQGWSVCPDFLSAPAVAALRGELESSRAALQPAAIGRGAGVLQDAAIRSDQTLWLDAQSPAQQQLLAQMETLRVQLNQRLLLGLFDCEAHFAVYPPGAFYRRHLDAFRAAASDQRPQRVLSSVIYLNPDWDVADGGELVLYDAADTELMRVQPLAGAAVFFLSEEFPHEVLPARRERYSIAGWFRSRS